MGKGKERKEKKEKTDSGLCGGSASCRVLCRHGRHLACLQTGDTTFNVPLRAAQQVSAHFLTLADSKLSPHRLVNSCSWKSQQGNTQFRG